ncbi:MAG TPA: hypothetical protein VED20_12095 [Streptosporangiaceae bacterium]|nr:hypothetical protein [Streptosporangiaceae bacterium]
MTRMAGLSYLRAGPDGLRIGALTTHRAVEISRDPAAVRERAVQLAARLLEAAEDDLDLAGGSVTVRGDPALRLTLAEIASCAAGWPGGSAAR